MTGRTPYPDKQDTAVVLLIVKGEHPSRPENRIPTNSQDGNRLWDLLRQCWSYKSLGRPPADQVFETVATTHTFAFGDADTTFTDENDHKGRSHAPRLISE
jgi:hypothetical protein